MGSNELKKSSLSKFTSIFFAFRVFTSCCCCFAAPNEIPENPVKLGCYYTKELLLDVLLITNDTFFSSYYYYYYFAKFGLLFPLPPSDNPFIALFASLILSLPNLIIAPPPPTAPLSMKLSYLLFNENTAEP